MKLRNKKTGEIIDLEVGRITDSGYGSAILLSPVAAINESYTYSSLAELNEEWEDYEPVIVDQETARYVRHWAKEWGIEEIRVGERAHSFRLVGKHTGLEEISIAIKFEFVRANVNPNRYYTIAELCGEEEE